MDTATLHLHVTIASRTVVVLNKPEVVARNGKWQWLSDIRLHMVFCIGCLAGLLEFPPQMGGIYSLEVAVTVVRCAYRLRILPCDMAGNIDATTLDARRNFLIAW